MAVEVARLLDDPNFDQDELVGYIDSIEIESNLTPEKLGELAQQGFARCMTDTTRLAMFWYLATETLKLVTLNGHSPNDRLKKLEQLGTELARAEVFFQRRKRWDASRNGNGNLNGSVKILL